MLENLCSVRLDKLQLESVKWNGVSGWPVCKYSRTVYLQRCKGAGQHWRKVTETRSRIVSFALVKTGGSKGILEWIMWDVQACLMHIMLNVGQSGTFLISVMSLQMAQFTEKVGVLIASNRNSISPWGRRVKWIKCKWGRCVETCDTETLMKGSD